MGSPGQLQGLGIAPDVIEPRQVVENPRVLWAGGQHPPVAGYRLVGTPCLLGDVGGQGPGRLVARIAGQPVVRLRQRLVDVAGVNPGIYLLAQHARIGPHRLGLPVGQRGLGRITGGQASIRLQKQPCGEIGMGSLDLAGR